MTLFLFSFSAFLVRFLTVYPSLIRCKRAVTPSAVTFPLPAPSRLPDVSSVLRRHIVRTPRCCCDLSVAHSSAPARHCFSAVTSHISVDGCYRVLLCWSGLGVGKVLRSHRTYSYMCVCWLFNYQPPASLNSDPHTLRWCFPLSLLPNF